MKTVLLSTSTVWNCGDDWIREGLLECLKLRDDVRVLWWNRGWGVRSIFANSLKVNMDLTDVVIMAGTPEWVDRNEAIYEQCVSLGKPVALLGVGRSGGYLEDKHGKLMKRVVKSKIIDLSIVRDVSAEWLLKDWGIRSHVMCDPAMFKLPLNPQRDLNIVGYRGVGLGPNDGNRHHSLRAGGPSKQLDTWLVEAFKALPRPKVVTVHDNREVRAAEELFGPQNVFYSSNHQDLYRLYARARYYIGSRIHGFVPSLVHGAAAHLIYPTPKAVAMETVVQRLQLEGNARVSIMGKHDDIEPDFDLIPIGDEIRERVDAESRLFRQRCLGVSWLSDLMA